jgi:hypothetical protein
MLATLKSGDVRVRLDSDPRRAAAFARIFGVTCAYVALREGALCW